MFMGKQKNIRKLLVWAYWVNPSYVADIIQALLDPLLSLFVLLYVGPAPPSRCATISPAHTENY